jgi:hypothetical protein
MEGDIIFSKMEDNLNFSKMEDDLKFFPNGRRPHFLGNSKSNPPILGLCTAQVMGFSSPFTGTKF